MEYYTFHTCRCDAGFIAKILVPDGASDIDIGVPVAILVEDAESVAAFKDYSEGGAAEAKPKGKASKAKAAAKAPAAEPKAPGGWLSPNGSDIRKMRANSADPLNFRTALLL